MAQAEPLPDHPTKGYVAESLLERLADAIGEIDQVSDVVVDRDRRPKRVRVTLNDGQIPDALRDVMDQYDGEIIDARSSGPGVLTLTLTFRGRQRSAGQVSVSKWGGSLVATVSREAREVSGFAEGDTLDVKVRDGEVVYRKLPGQPDQ